VLLPNLEARLVIADSSSPEGKEGTDAKSGEPGELWIRGPTVMKVHYCVLLTLFPMYAMLL
jgi:acyl-CoA synthetase (AMP-forming)/AMP-acid ligase II